MQRTNLENTATSRIPVINDSPAVRHLAMLALSLLLAVLMVWKLRQDGAEAQPLLWVLFLIVIFAASSSLRQLDLWLPGQPILPRLEKISSQTLTIIGALSIAAAIAFAWISVRQLLPDYQTLWKGILQLWFGSMILLLAGTGMLGAVGRGAPRAATSSTPWDASSRSRLLEAAAFLLILLLAVLLRTYRIESIPPGLYVDETNAAVDALYILDGRSVSPFGVSWTGTPNSYFYYMAGVFKLFGTDWTSLKLISIIPSIATVAAIYFWGRLVLGPSAGLIAMFFMAVSRWHLSISRWGLSETMLPLFLIIALFFLIRGLRERRAFDYAFSGLVTGLSLYASFHAKLVADILFLYIILWILSDPSGVRTSLKRSWLGFVLFILAIGITLAPLAVTFVKDPGAIRNHTLESGVLRDMRDQKSMKPLFQNIGDALRLFHQSGDPQGRNNLPDEPMMDPLTGLFFAVGFAYSILRWRDQRYWLLLLWLIIGLSGSYLSSRGESPQTYRSLIALPAALLMAADMLDRVIRALYRFIQVKIPVETRPRMPALISGGVAAFALIGATAWETNIYFGRQASSAVVERGFSPIENQVGDEVVNALSTNTEIYLSSRLSDLSPLRFMLYTQGAVKTLDERPYHIVVPESDLPLQDTGRDVLILLDSNYWQVRDYITLFYPNANIELIKLSDDSPAYVRVEIPYEQIIALQGLTKTITYEDGHMEQLSVPEVEADIHDLQVTQVAWNGMLRIEHGGEYEIQGEGGMDVSINNIPANGRQYLGRGLYGIQVTWTSGDGTGGHLIWRTPGQDWTRTPSTLLFSADQKQGLLGTYWNNMNWENEPMFHQVTPFLMLAWNNEQPIVPAGPFSARYTGLLKITEPGTYVFRIEADDGARLIIDGNLLGEGLTPGQSNRFDATMDLATGNHPIQVDYFQQGGASGLRLFWRMGNKEWTPVPPANLIPAQP